MIPRLDISFPLCSQHAFWFGKAYTPQAGEYLLNHARSGIVMALRTALPQGGRVGVVAYNCHTVANAVMEAECTPVFLDVTDHLQIDLTYLAKQYINAVIVTNLFGIHNDINAIKAAQPNAIIIVDNAHGYGLPAEGDFTVYSINQGKFPSLGEGGILVMNNIQYADTIDKLYASLPAYSRIKEIKLFFIMLLKAIAHCPWIYQYITMRIKQSRKIVDCHEPVVLSRMARGVSRMYQHLKDEIPHLMVQQQSNAQTIINQLSIIGGVQYALTGENGWMVVARTHHVDTLHNLFLSNKVETATHFANCITWAKQFGYTEGQCPQAEQLTKELIMIPTYKTSKL